MDDSGKKIIYIVAAIAIAVFLGYFIFASLKGEEPKAEVKLTGPALSQKIAGFLSASQNLDGSFQLSYTCSESFTEKCRPQPLEGPLHGGQIILAFYDLAKKTEDKSYKEKADLGMKFVMERCPEEPLICQWHFFPLYVYYQDTEESKYLEGMLKVADELLAEKPFNDFVDANTGVKLAILYEVTGDKKYLNRLEKVANSALNLSDTDLLEENGNRVIYEVDGTQVRARAISTVWSVLLPAYRATGKPKYLQSAKDFYDRAKLGAHADFYARGGRGVSFLIMAIESLAELSEISKDQNYLEEARVISQTLIRRQLDSKEAPKFTGDYGFLLLMGADPNQKQTLYSGWLVRLLLRIGGEYSLL